MANLFYGVSTTTEDVTAKEVTIYNPLHDEIVPGDLLAVYFSNGNTVVAPTLVIQGTSLSTGEDEQTSLSTDDGTFIKTKNVEDNVDYMWQAGEVCLFVLVSQQDNTDIVQEYDSPTQDATGNDTLYYMLVRGARANSEYYGLTKLFTDQFGEGKYKNFREWLADEEAEEDKITAATPYLVKQLSEFLIGKIEAQEDEGGDEGDDPTPAPPQEQTPAINITYVPEVAEGFKIGTLTTNTDTYDILIPNQTSGDSEESEIAIHNKTSDVKNDADIVPGNTQGTFKHNRREPDETYTVGTHFITNVVDGGLYLYGPSGGAGLYIADPEIDEVADVNAPVEGYLSKKSLIGRNGAGNIVLNEGFSNRPLSVYGFSVDFWSGSRGSNTLTLDNGVKANVPVSAPEYSEGGISLVNKYAHTLTVLKVRLGEGAPKAAEAADTSKISYSIYQNNAWTHVGRKRAIYQKGDGVTGHKYIRIKVPGYKPLGLVGYNISYASESSGYTAYDNNNKKITANNSDASYQILWEFNLTGQQVSGTNGYGLINYDTRNTKSTQVGFFIDAYVLCEKIY